MINENLTLEGALSGIGEPLEVLVLEIDPNHPIVEAWRQTREIVKAIESDPRLTVDGVPGGDPGLALRGRFGDSSPLLDQMERSGINDITLQARRGGQDAPQMTYAMLTNLIAHGMRFDEAGAGTLRIMLGTEGIVVVADQPLPVPEFKIPENSLRHPIDYPRGCGVGTGTLLFVNSQGFEVNRDTLPNGGGRVIGFAPCGEKLHSKKSFASIGVSI